MKAQLIDKANVWYRLWSIRFAILAAVFGAIEASLPLWEKQIPPGIFAGLATLAAIGSGVSRVIKQVGFSLPETGDEQ